MKLTLLVCTTLLLLLVAGSLAGCGSPAVVSEGGASTPTIEPTAPPKATSTTEPADTPPTATAPAETPVVPTGTASPTTADTATAALPTATETPEPEATPTESPVSSATPPPPTSPPATSTPTTALAPATPAIHSFTVEPQVARNVGDSLQLAWDTSGERAVLCPIKCRPVACQDVPLSGTKTWVNDEQSLTYSGFALMVNVADQEMVKTVQVDFLCENQRQWFFDNPPPRCSQDEAVVSYAAGQFFERGFMIWIEETDEMCVFETEPRPGNIKHYYCMANVGQYLKPGASADNRLGEDSPPGLQEPVSGFGLVWREEVDWPEAGGVRQRLGWATEPEFGFDTAWQNAVPKCMWTRYLRGPGGEILVMSPATTIGWPLTWDYHE